MGFSVGKYMDKCGWDKEKRRNSGHHLSSSCYILNSVLDTSLFILMWGYVYWLEGVGEERGTLMWDWNTNQLPPVHALTSDGIHSLGMWAERGLNQWLFGVQCFNQLDHPARATLHPFYTRVLISHNTQGGSYFMYKGKMERGRREKWGRSEGGSDLV